MGHPLTGIAEVYDSNCPAWRVRDDNIPCRLVALHRAYVAVVVMNSFQRHETHRRINDVIECSLLGEMKLERVFFVVPRINRRKLGRPQRPDGALLRHREKSTAE